MIIFMPERIMLDIETLGNSPGSVIVSLGAVKFGGGEIRDTFYRRIDAESCVRQGLRMDVSTVLWWMKQGDAARAELNKPAEDLANVLLAFSQWLDPRNEAEIWGNGATFDNVLLAEAYAACRIRRPWKFSNDRCYRTVKALHPHVELTRQGTHHNALDDAASQAKHLMLMLPNL